MQATSRQHPDDPHLLAFEEFIGPTGVFHSLDVTIFRNGQHAYDVELRSFEHFRDPDMTRVKFMFYDPSHNVKEHDYLLTVVLRYLQVVDGLHM